MTTISARRWLGVLAAAAALVTTAACDEATTEDPTGQPTDQSTATDGPATEDGSGTEGTATDDTRLYFFPPVEGAEFTFSNDAGIGDMHFRVVDVEGGPDEQTVRIEYTIPGEADATVEAAYVTPADGGLIMPVSQFFMSMNSTSPAFGSQMQLEISGDDLVIPPIEEMEAGATTDGSVTVEMTMEGMSFSSDSSFTVRGAGYESVTVPLGTYDAYVVEVDFTMQLEFGPSTDMAIRYWLLPGYGRIRQETTVNGTTTVEELSASTVTP